MSAVQRSQRVTIFESYPVNPFSEKVLVHVPKLTIRAEALSTKLFDQPWSLDPMHFDRCDYEEVAPGVGHLHRRDCLRDLCDLL